VQKNKSMKWGGGGVTCQADGGGDLTDGVAGHRGGILVLLGGGGNAPAAKRRTGNQSQILDGCCASSVTFCCSFVGEGKPLRSQAAVVDS